MIMVIVIFGSAHLRIDLKHTIIARMENIYNVIPDFPRLLTTSVGRMEESNSRISGFKL